MNKELYNIASWSIKTAKSSGADECRVRIDNQRLVETSYRNQKPENIKEASTRGLGVEVYANGRYSVQTTSDLRKTAVKDFISNAVSTTKLLAKDPYRNLPDPKYYQGREDKDLELVDPEHKNFGPKDRHEMVKEIEQACLEKGGDKAISVTAEQQDSYAEEVLLSSNGFQGHREATVYVAVASMTAKGDGARRPSDYSFVVCTHRKEMPEPEHIGREAAKRTLNLLGAKKIKTETLPIILENRQVSRFLGGFLAAMYGSSIQQKRSFLSNKKGKRVGSSHFTLKDDPFIKGGLGSRLYDGDGFAAKKRTMTDGGMLKDFYIGWYYSQKLGWEPTTGGPSNLVIPSGKRSVKEIMKDLGRGIFITGFIGGNSNSTTGDASIGIIGQLFENGEPVQAVSEMNIAGNHLKFWQRLVETANDPWIYSSYRTPSLVFEDMVVSGL
ncbi:MAG: TldD/PmbA family protein [Candidatus Aminicenantes bacterium]|nr:TldD/PmbA family protein [Candidatus Aminicenantes bacterium]